METIVGLLAFPYLIGLAILGYLRSPWWVVPVAAIVGSVMYVLMRPAITRAIARDGFAQTALMVYITQAFTAVIAFAIGRVVGGVL